MNNTLKKITIPFCFNLKQVKKSKSFFDIIYHLKFKKIFIN